MDHPKGEQAVRLMIRFNDIIEKLSSSYSEKDLGLLRKAYVYAASAHKGQVRMSGEPYLNHPLEVANILADLNLDVTTLAAGLLHDVLEDTDVTASEIQEAFGNDISHLVEGVTKISLVQESSPETRQAESIRKIILAMTDDLRVIFIKLADRIHNLKTLKYLDEKKQKQIAEETLELYAPIANRLGMGRIKAVLEDLAFRFVDPEQYFKITSLVDPKRMQTEKVLKKHRKTIETLLAEHNISAEIHYRLKRPYSIHRKMKQKGIYFDQVYDFMALRLILRSIPDCYTALGIIHQKWPHLPHRFHDFISMPKPNLYQSLHTTIITEKKQMIEIQIRTQEMHDLAENGISAHWRYKDPDPKSKMKDDKRLFWLREMVDVYREQKNPREFLQGLKTGLIPEDVFVYSPKGKTVTLPLGSSALDFAFKIHSEIGLHASGAKVNGHAAPLRTILKSGDVVEIITDPESTPARGWLNQVFTPTARQQLKHWLNIQDKAKNTILGQKLWEKALKKYRLPLESIKKVVNPLNLNQVFNFRIKTLEEFYALIGSGKIVLNQKFMEKLFSQKPLPAKKETILNKVVTKVKTKPKSVILVKDVKNQLVKLAECCNPIKGEPILGYMTSGRGLTIHARRCPRLRKGNWDEQRLVDVSWDKTSTGYYKGTLLIEGEDSPGVLAKLTATIAQLGGNISKAEVKTFSDKKAQIKLSLRIKDIDHFQNIIKKTTKIKEVDSVDRL